MPKSGFILLCPLNSQQGSGNTAAQNLCQMSRISETSTKVFVNLEHLLLMGLSMIGYSGTNSLTLLMRTTTVLITLSPLCKLSLCTTKLHQFLVSVLQHVLCFTLLTCICATFTSKNMLRSQRVWSSLEWDFAQLNYSFDKFCPHMDGASSPLTPATPSRCPHPSAHLDARAKPHPCAWEKTPGKNPIQVPGQHLSRGGSRLFVKVGVELACMSILQIKSQSAIAINSCFVFFYFRAEGVLSPPPPPDPPLLWKKPIHDRNPFSFCLGNCLGKT